MAETQKAEDSRIRDCSLEEVWEGEFISQCVEGICDADLCLCVGEMTGWTSLSAMAW